jgi:hypothetical protein
LLVDLGDMLFREAPIRMSSAGVTITPELAIESCRDETRRSADGAVSA